MVPSDSLPQRRLTAGMHGLSLAIGTVNDICFAPRIQPSGRMRLGAPQPVCAHSRTEPIFRSGLSLACNENLFPGSHSKVNAPGLLLRHPSDLHRIRSGPMLQNRPTGLHSPSGGFYAPPDRSVQPVQLSGSSPFARRPITLRSPRP